MFEVSNEVKLDFTDVLLVPDLAPSTRAVRSI